MKQALRQKGVTHLSLIEVEVKKSPDQGAIYREEF